MDPQKIAITGLSGGGWQTIMAGALDERFTLVVPVAGYASFHTKIDYERDVGDSEQAPVDLASIADYAELTALLAPRPALLINNQNDPCCFGAEYAVEPLLLTADPIYELLGVSDNLTSHVDLTSLTHNYDAGNREAFYAALRQHFFGGGPLSTVDIPSGDELKTSVELMVSIPAPVGFDELATTACLGLPLQQQLATSIDVALAWQQTNRMLLRRTARFADTQITSASESAGDIGVTHWELATSNGLTIPVTELRPFNYTHTRILIADAGRANSHDQVQALVDAGVRVFAMDPILRGEASVETWKQQLLVGAAGERTIGLQAGQVAAVARWIKANMDVSELAISGIGETSGVVSLIASALESEAIDAVRVHNALGSLHEIIERNDEFSDAPDLFVFGLLRDFDILHLAALSAPRLVTFSDPSVRVRAEMAPLEQWYSVFGVDFDPVGD